MDQGAFDRVAVSFAGFHGEFAPLFGRKDTQRRSEQYLRGLLVQQTDRRNAENMAETIAGATPRTLQRLLTEAPWPTEPVLERLQASIGARLNEPSGVFVIDESGFPKQGKHSVGVARQYCGSLGKVGNGGIPGLCFLPGAGVGRDAARAAEVLDGGSGPLPGGRGAGRHRVPE